MEMKNKHSENIPAFLAGALDEHEKAELEKALAESSELREELGFWKKLRSLSRLDAIEAEAGHITTEVLLDYLEGSLPNPAAVEGHLASCTSCREDVEAARRILPTPDKRQVRQGLIDRIIAFLTPPRIGYALAIVAVVIVLINVIWVEPGRRTPEWKQLQAEADEKILQGDDSTADVMYRHALVLMDGVDESHAGDISLILDSLATISQRAGNTAEARRLLDRSLAVRQSEGLGDTWSAAWEFEQVGNLEKEAGNTLLAESFYRKADGIREVLALKDPGDHTLQRYRRNVALIRLVPQVGFRGPDTPPFPLISLDEQTTHTEFLIVLRRNRDLTARYLPTLTTPSRETFPLPDTLTVDPLHPSERTLRLTLSKRFFEEGKGTYRIGIRRLDGLRDGFEDMYGFVVAQ